MKNLVLNLRKTSPSCSKQRHSIKSHQAFYKKMAFSGLLLSPKFFDVEEKVFLDPNLLVYEFKSYLHSDHYFGLSPSCEVNHQWSVPQSCPPLNVWGILNPATLNPINLGILRESIVLSKSLSKKGFFDSISSHRPIYCLTCDETKLDIQELLQKLNWNLLLPEETKQSIKRYFTFLEQKHKTHPYLNLRASLNPNFLIISCSYENGTPKEVLNDQPEPFALSGGTQALPLTLIKDFTTSGKIEYSILVEFQNLGNCFSRVNFKNSQFFIFPSNIE